MEAVTERIVVEHELDYAPRKPFVAFHERSERWAVLVCHRRAGKTVACVNELVKAALDADTGDWRGGYVAPYRSQAKAVAWDYLKRFTAIVPGIQWNESELRCDFPNGSRIRLFGADGADVSMRGIYLDLVVLDEYADMKPSLWAEVIRPLLADRRGRAVFIGTPKGRNAFYRIWNEADDSWHRLMLRASESDILPADELAAAKAQMTPEAYEQEFECSFDAALRGAYYAKDIERARRDGRVTGVPYDPMLPVYTAWDLGMADHTAIIFWQQTRGGEVRIVDAYEAAGYGLDHYANVLRERGYNYGDHFAPHDIQVRELGTGRSRLEVAQSLGINFRVLPQQRIADGINAVRMMLPRCWFDERRCGDLLEALTQYQEKRDEKRDVALGPLHDWTSHFADSMRYAAAAQDMTGSADWGRPISYDSRGIV